MVRPILPHSHYIYIIYTLFAIVCVKEEHVCAMMLVAQCTVRTAERRVQTPNELMTLPVRAALRGRRSEGKDQEYW